MGPLAEGRTIMRITTRKAYDKWLAQVCHCYPDEVGNRPCDNGCMCDRCMYPPVSFEEYCNYHLQEG